MHGPSARWMLFNILDAVQVATMAGIVYTCVQVLAACLYLTTMTSKDDGYYPGNEMVSVLKQDSPSAAVVPCMSVLESPFV